MQDDLTTELTDTGSVPFFDATSAAWLNRYCEDSPGGYALRIRKQRVLELLDRAGGNLLDVGCGAGAMAADAVALGYRFWGIDGSCRMIETCRSTFRYDSRMHFSVGCATRIDFPDNFFDAVLCMGVIDHVADYRAALREMVRVLRPGGQAIISFPNRHCAYAVWRNSVFYPAMRMLRAPYYTLRGRPAPPALSSQATLFSEARVVDLLQDLAVRVNRIVYFNFNVCLSPLDEIFPRAAMRLTSALESRPGTGEAAQFRALLGAGFLADLRKPGTPV
jgi:2-polyprenyl-3-methyl-5-hydroxy-6-metoxy-1,4-benzoquinol methylase